MSRMISFLVLVAVILGIGILFYRVMSTFLLPLFLAAVVVVVFRPVHQWCLEKCRNMRRTSAALATLIVTLVVFLPSGLVGSMAVVEGTSLLTQLDINGVKEKLARVRERFGLQMPHAEKLHAIQAELIGMQQSQYESDQARQEDVDALIEHLDALQESFTEQEAQQVSLLPLRLSLVQLSDIHSGSHKSKLAVDKARDEFRRVKLQLLGGPLWAVPIEIFNPSEERLRSLNRDLLSTVRPWLWEATGVTFGVIVKVIIGIVILLISTYFFFADGPEMIAGVMRLSPLDDHYEHELLKEFDSVSRAVVLATLLSAVVQGLLAGAGFWLAGLDSVFLLILLTTVCAMVPFVGAATVWVPISLYLVFYEERMLAGVLLAIYGTAIVSMADNVIKPMVLHGQSRLHPLLALLSVLGGVQALGPIGILVGPMAVVFLQTSLRILQRELSELEDEVPGLEA